MSLHFSITSFTELNPHELYAYLQLRSEVFVVEQNCVYQDLDDKDQVSLHALESCPQIFRILKFLLDELLLPKPAANNILVMSLCAFVSSKYIQGLVLNRLCCRPKPICKTFIKNTTLYQREQST